MMQTVGLYNDTVIELDTKAKFTNSFNYLEYFIVIQMYNINVLILVKMIDLCS